MRPAPPPVGDKKTLENGGQVVYTEENTAGRTVWEKQ